MKQIKSLAYQAIMARPYPCVPVPDGAGMDAKILYSYITAGMAVVMSDMKRACRFPQSQIKTDHQ